MKQANTLIYFKWMKSIDPRELDKKIRDLIARGELPPVYTMLVCVDHKNLEYNGQRRYRDGIPIEERPHKRLNQYEKTVIAVGGKLDR